MRERREEKQAEGMRGKQRTESIGSCLSGQQYEDEKELWRFIRWKPQWIDTPIKHCKHYFFDLGLRGR